MNFKKLVLLGGLIAGINASIYAAGRIAAAGIGVVSGVAYEGIVYHTPWWVSVPGVAATLLAQFMMVRTINTYVGFGNGDDIDHRRASMLNLGISAVAAVIAAVISFNVDNYLNKKNQNNHKTPEELS